MPQFSNFSEKEKVDYATKPGNIITFKEPQANGRSTQIIVNKVIVDVKSSSDCPMYIEGMFGNNSKKYDNVYAMLAAIDWAWMEKYVD